MQKIRRQKSESRRWSTSCNLRIFYRILIFSELWINIGMHTSRILQYRWDRFNRRKKRIFNQILKSQVMNFYNIYDLITIKNTIYTKKLIYLIIRNVAPWAPLRNSNTIIAGIFFVLSTIISYGGAAYLLDRLGKKRDFRPFM